jgi:hypothetical protein
MNWVYKQISEVAEKLEKNDVRLFVILDRVPRMAA